MTWFSGLDERLFHKINGEWTHPWLDAFFPVWTDIHKSLVFILIVAAFLGWFFLKKRRRNLAILLAATAGAVVVDNLNSGIIKPIFARSRPLASALPFDVIIRGQTSGGFAFPSGHAATAFFLAFFLSFYFRRAALLFISFATLTAYSRIYCGVHFPADVFAGAMVGAAGAGLSVFIFNKVESRIHG